MGLMLVTCARCHMIALGLGSFELAGNENFWLPDLSVEAMKKNHCIFSSQPRADQMPGPPREGQLMCTLFLSTHQ